MSIIREYYDNSGNYWLIDTPEYIIPDKAIKHPEYVKQFFSAKDRKNRKPLSEQIKALNKVLVWANIVAIIILVIVIVCKYFV